MKNIIFNEKAKNFLDGPGDIEKNRKNLPGKTDFLSNKPAIIITGILCVVLTAFFYFFPNVDIEFTKLFYMGDGKFLMAGSPVNYFYHKILVLMMGFSLIIISLAYIVGEFHKKPVWTLTRRRFFFIILSFAIAAGFMTGFILKSHWGRARPRDIMEFHGTKQFTAAGVISDQCRGNCSFVSGETSLAVCFLSLALLAGKHRKIWFWVITLFAASVAIMRVATGAHFLSDVILAGLYSLLVILILERILLIRSLPEKTAG